jgi:hypothetical protein
VDHHAKLENTLRFVEDVSKMSSGRGASKSTAASGGTTPSS